MDCAGNDPAGDLWVNRLRLTDFVALEAARQEDEEKTAQGQANQGA